MPRVSRRTCSAFASALTSAARFLATSFGSNCMEKRLSTAVSKDLHCTTMRE